MSKLCTIVYAAWQAALLRLLTATATLASVRSSSGRSRKVCGRDCYTHRFGGGNTAKANDQHSSAAGTRRWWCLCLPWCVLKTARAGA